MNTLTPYDISGGIATVTLNRPQKLNAISYAMVDALMNVLDAVETNAAVGAVILTGAGDKAFCAGGDMKAGATQGKVSTPQPADFCQKP